MAYVFFLRLTKEFGILLFFKSPLLLIRVTRRITEKKNKKGLNQVADLVYTKETNQLFFIFFDKIMGNCTSSVPHGSKRGTNPDAQSNRTIERQIKADEKRLRTEVKLLLLGKHTV